MSGALQNNDGSKKRWKHGKAVVKGDVRYTSVSALELAESCTRRWFYRYVQGIKDDDDDSEALKRGNKCHAEVAHYLTTGDRSGLSSIVLSGLNQLPPPGKNLAVELDIVPDLPDGSSGLSQARLRAGGIPLVGAIDLMHMHEENFGVTDIMDIKDPPNTLKLEDHKFPNSLNNIKSSNELVKTLQMAGYARWGFATFGNDLERIRLSHNYFPVRGNPLKVTTLVSREQVEETWKRADAIAVSIRDAARETNADRIDANTRACRAYGRDCPAKSVCKAASHNSLSSIFGITAADRLVDQLKPKIHLPVLGEEMIVPTPAPNSLVARLAAANAANGLMPPDARSVNPGQPVTYHATAPAPTIEAEVARLAVQETPGIAQIIAEIDSYGIGTPAYAGPAYIAVCQAKGYPPTPGSGLAGAGELGQYTISDPSMLPAVLEEVRGIAKQRGLQPRAIAPTVAAILPPDAPPSNPVLASKPPDAEPKKRGRKTKEKAAVEPQVVQVVVPAGSTTQQIEQAILETPATPVTTAVPEPVNPAATTTTTNRLFFYVDCIPDGVTTQSFWPIVHQLTDMLASEDKVPDIRCGDKLDYGKWEGALAAYIKEAYRTGMIKNENYVFESGTRFAQVIIETMREVVYKAGGVFVRGVR